MLTKFGQWLLAHNRNAGMVAFAFTMLPLLYLPGAFLAAVIVGLVTLQHGMKAGLEVLVWVALPALVLLYMHSFGTFDVLLVRCAIVWLFAVLLRSYQSWPLVLEVATLLGVVAVVMLHFYLPDVSGMWSQLINDFIAKNPVMQSWKNSAEIQASIQQFVPVATGIAGFIMLLGSLVQLLLARWWQSILYNPGGLRKEFTQIRLSQTTAMISMLLLLGLFFKQPVIVDFAPILLLPFMVAGLSMAHWWVGVKQGWFMVLITAYIGLFFLTVYMVVLLALLGYADSWYDFRRRFKMN